MLNLLRQLLIFGNEVSRGPLRAAALARAEDHPVAFRMKEFSAVGEGAFAARLASHGDRNMFGENAFSALAASGYRVFAFHGPESYHRMRSRTMPNGAKREQRP